MVPSRARSLVSRYTRYRLQHRLRLAVEPLRRSDTLPLASSYNLGQLLPLLSNLFSRLFTL
jgi:hypothetical protein